MNLPEIPKKLIEKIQQDNLVIFIGAGFSINAGYPNWKNLTIGILNGLTDYEPKAKKLISALEEDLFEPIEILSKIENNKKYAIEIFEKEMRRFNKIEPSPLHSKISKVSSKLITTNYDTLLESSNNTFEKITYTNTYKISKLSEYPNYIFKIHGDLNEPDKCILFPSEYDSLYSNDEKCSIFEFKKLISDKSVLFIGFSLNDPYINYVLSYVTSLYSGFSPEHFIITTETNNNWPERVTPIKIESYSDLEALIDLLIEKKSISNYNEIKELEIQTQEESILNFSKDYEYDIPPSNKHWVGRVKEIENISNENFKVIFITGIGGQGKSALAAHFLKNNFNNKIYEFGDWRDFKEETNRFQTKLISIIKRLTKGEIDAKQLESLNTKDLVDTFFHYLGNRRIIFVFDNIDSYIDLETFMPTGGFGYLFEKAITGPHLSKFIFTCRPFIREANVNFYQISLSGITKDECIELFNCYTIPIRKSELDELCQKAHILTKGHPLWLNLIAAQALRGLDTVNNFISNIENKTEFDEEDFSSILSQKILNQVWLSLNEKQQHLLRGIAETVKPESLRNLKQILDSELNNNQFEKAFRNLKNLNLIEVKNSSISEEQIELHPLVKEFILTKYPKTERAKYITLLVRYYDSFIYILKPKLSSKLSLSSFQNWTSKIELEINKGDFKPALIALQEVYSSILSAGFVEEYLRVAERLFDSINWNEAFEYEYSYFHSQFSYLITALIQYGKYEKADNLLDKYEKLIPGKSGFYLSYCSAKCYLNWFQEKYKEAVLYGEKGEFLLNSSNLSDTNSLKHNLALARRDSRDKNKIKEALKFFLKNEKIEDVVNIKSFKRELGGHFYGNVGRCLELLNNKKQAINCYFISLDILLNEDDENTKLNIGYACSWISELYLSESRIQNALYYLKFAIFQWHESVPPKAIKLKERWENIVCDIETKQAIDKMADWQIEKFCKENLNKIFSR